MARAVILDTILMDSVLQGMGFDSSNVIPNYDGEQRPSDKMFMVLRWETQDIELSGDDATMRRGPRHLVIWVHMYKDFSTDFVRIDDVIDRLDHILTDIIDQPGADGRTVTCVEPEGHSRDLKDTTYETFCRSASFKILNRAT